MREFREFVVSDAIAGPAKALAMGCPKEKHQRCWACKLPNIAEKVGKADHRRVPAGAGRIYLASHLSGATHAFQ